MQIGPMPPPHGGVSTNMLAIHEHLVRKGHESRVVDVTEKGRKEDRPFVLKPRSAVGLLRLLSAIDADLLHYHIGGEFSLRLALLTLYCGVLPGKRSVVTFHSGGFARSAAGRARRMSIRGVAFRSQDRVVGVNPEMLSMFEAYGVAPDRSRMILPFELKAPDASTVVPAEFEEFVNSSKPLIISVGSLEKEYRHSAAIDALIPIFEKFPDAKMLIAGSGPMKHELEAKVAELDLGTKVLIAGNLDREVLLCLMARAGAMLRITDYDGDAISVREGLFLGIPVIATDNGMRPVGVRLVSEAAGPDEIAASIMEAISQSNGRKPVITIPESNAAKVIELYEDVIFG